MWKVPSGIQNLLEGGCQQGLERIMKGRAAAAWQQLAKPSGTEWRWVPGPEGW